MLTIGIPTYNRSGILQTSLRSVLNQTSNEVKVIVSDNASTDDTEAVVRRFGSDIRYERNSENIGPWRNFKRLVELCDTEYFSWLQDDDCLDHRFAQRALRTLRADPSVSVYSAYAMLSHGMESHFKPTIFGPPFPINFLNGEGVRVYDGRLVAPFSLFTSVTFPPISAYRTEALRDYLNAPTGLTVLFAERSWGFHAAARGSFAVDPFIGAIVRLHSGQGQLEILHREKQEWNVMAQDLDQLVAAWNPDWLDGFSRVLRDIEPIYRLNWLQRSEAWPRDLAICRQVAKALKDSLPDFTSRSEPTLKVFLRNITPPVLWKGLGAAKRRLSAR